MKAFFDVTPLEELLGHIPGFARTDTEVVSLAEAAGRILGCSRFADVDLPGFSRSVVDGYAVRAATTFGASESNPGYLVLKGRVEMGTSPSLTLDSGEAVHMPTGGMLPPGADAVVMVEHTEALDDTTIEIHKSVAPGQNVIQQGEDFRKGELIVKQGCCIRPQEIGLLAAFGHNQVVVYRKPRIGIISTGDEIISVDEIPRLGQVRDVNTYTLSALVKAAGGIPLISGVVKDDYGALLDACTQAVQESDMLLLSGGSSVGTRDLTLDVFAALPDARILAHGVPISPGKPTILASIMNKPCWGLPGHVVSAMVVFDAVVRRFVDHLAGRSPHARDRFTIPARLSRNLSSAQGRIDFVRVRLRREDGDLWADPVLGKSGLINSMVNADGLIEVGMNTEGLDEGADVCVLPF